MPTLRHVLNVVVFNILTSFRFNTQSLGFTLAYGTGSTSFFCQGWHEIIRFIAKYPPFHAPYFLIAIRPYSEHGGCILQVADVIGRIKIRYKYTINTNKYVQIKVKMIIFCLKVDQFD